MATKCSRHSPNVVGQFVLPLEWSHSRRQNQLCVVAALCRHYGIAANYSFAAMRRLFGPSVDIRSPARMAGTEGSEQSGPSLLQRDNMFEAFTHRISFGVWFSKTFGPTRNVLLYAQQHIP